MKELKRDLLRTKYTRVLAEEDFKIASGATYAIIPCGG